MAVGVAMVAGAMDYADLQAAASGRKLTTPPNY